MENGLQTQQTAAIQVRGNTQFVHNGNGGTQIGYVGQQTNYIQLSGYEMSFLPQEINSEYYNLFVTDQEQLDGLISIPRSCALNEYTEPGVRTLYAGPDLAATKTHIMKLPSLFVRRNKYGNHTSPGQIAGVGFVRDIQIKSDSIQIMASQLRPVDQGKLNTLARELCLLCAPENNELGEVHWAIKKLDLMRLIQEQRLLMGA